MGGAALDISPAAHAFVSSGGASRRRVSPSSDIAFSLAPRTPGLATGREVSDFLRSGPRHSKPSSAFSSSLPEWTAVHSILSGCRVSAFKVRARSVPDGAGESTIAAPAGMEPNSGGLMRLLRLGVLFVLWILFNIYFNIYNKQVLKVHSYPVTITAVQFAVGTLFVLFSWATNLVKKPKISSSQLLAIVPLAVVHTLGNLLTNVSLGKVAVSFTHTIKAMEPFFSVMLTAMFIGEVPSLLVMLSLVPIVGGVVLASITEVSFNWSGFWSAMASNLTNQSRNVLSKKMMANEEEALDDINLFSVITIISFILMVPVTLLTEGVKITPSYVQSAGLNVKEIYVRSVLSGICSYAYQQVAYMILAYVSPVTLSVGNNVKRVVVIVSAVLFFRTPVSPLNALGTAVALAGVFLYSKATKLKPMPKLA